MSTNNNLPPRKILIPPPAKPNVVQSSSSSQQQQVLSTAPVSATTTTTSWPDFITLRKHLDGEIVAFDVFTHIHAHGLQCPLGKLLISPPNMPPFRLYFLFAILLESAGIASSFVNYCVNGVNGDVQKLINLFNDHIKSFLTVKTPSIAYDFINESSMISLGIKARTSGTITTARVYDSYIKYMPPIFPEEVVKPLYTYIQKESETINGLIEYNRQNKGSFMYESLEDFKYGVFNVIQRSSDNDNFNGELFPHIFNAFLIGGKPQMNGAAFYQGFLYGRELAKECSEPIK